MAPTSDASGRRRTSFISTLLRASEAPRRRTAGEEEVDEIEDVRDVDGAVAVDVSVGARAHEDERRSDVAVVQDATEYRRAAVGRDGGRRPLGGIAGCAGPDPLGAALRPDATAPREDPGRSRLGAVKGSADDRRRAVGREGDRPALGRSPDPVLTAELDTLL